MCVCDLQWMQCADKTRRSNPQRNGNQNVCASERVREILVNNRILFVNPFRSAIFIKSEFINFDYFIFSVVSSVRRSFARLCTTPRACITAIPTQPNINPRVFFEQFLLLNSSFGFLFVSPFLAIDSQSVGRTCLASPGITLQHILPVCACVAGMIDALLMKYENTYMCALIHFHFTFFHFYLFFRTKKVNSVFVRHILYISRLVCLVRRRISRQIFVDSTNNMFSYFTSCVFSCDCCLLSQSNKEKKKKKTYV